MLDNNSEDGTIEWLKALGELNLEGFDYYLSPVNEGTAIGKNLALRLCDGDISGISDDDVWYNTGWLIECMKAMEVFPELAVITAYRNSIGAASEQQGEGPEESRKGVDIIYRKSSCPLQWIVRRSAVLMYGGFTNANWLRGKGYNGNGKMGYSSAKLCKDINTGQQFKIARLKNIFDVDGDRYVIAMDKDTCSLNEVEFYEKTGYNKFRAIEKGLIKGEKWQGFSM